jgi:transcriptional regulator with XRE-family HTH domain
MTFREQVQEVRARLNLTQIQLASELGVAISTVNRWESGKFNATFLVRRRFESYCKQHGITFEEKSE